MLLVSISIGGVKCYFWHQKIQKLWYICGAIKLPVFYVTLLASLFLYYIFSSPLLRGLCGFCGSVFIETNSWRNGCIVTPNRSWCSGGRSGFSYLWQSHHLVSTTNSASKSWSLLSNIYGLPNIETISFCYSFVWVPILVKDIFMNSF